jgi:hypothetical protein
MQRGMRREISRSAIVLPSICFLIGFRLSLHEYAAGKDIFSLNRDQIFFCEGIFVLRE